MTTMIIPLDKLSKRIDRQKSELEILRQEYEQRQEQLNQLQQRKQSLQEAIKQVEEEIRQVRQGQATPSRPAKPTKAKTSPAGKTKPRKAGSQPSLPDMLLAILQETGRPMTVKELSEELGRRQYQTTSKNVPGLVQTRVKDLLQRGMLRRSSGQPGVELVAAPPSPPPALTVAEVKEKPTSAKKTTPAEATTNGQSTQLTLREVLTQTLAKSRKPLVARELAERVLATGFRSTSNNFPNLVKVALTKMDNVENVKGQGYRLKKSK
ncbi:MAG: hypothetical protein ACK4RK_10430 [Gemmataceae bacterium]